MQQRAEEEMRRKQQEKERVIAERKAWAQAKLEQRLERISRAAEERKKRDAAYCQLLETTREYAPHAPPQGRFYCSTLPRYSWSQCWGACTHVSVHLHFPAERVNRNHAQPQQMPA